MRFMRPLATACLFAALSHSRSLAGPLPGAADLMRPVQAFSLAFNAGQTAFPHDAFTNDCSVIDGFAPYAWNGAEGDVHAWWSRLLGSSSAANHKRFLLLKEHLEWGTPIHVAIKDDRGYISTAGTLTYDLNGERHVQRAIFTAAEINTAEGWRIRAHAWSITSDQ